MGFFADKTFQDKSNKYRFPNPDDKKDDSFFLNFFKAMYADFVRDKGGIPYSRRFDFNMFRLYAEGNQPTEKYMDILCPFPDGKQGGTNDEREGWMNVSWDILSVAPKFERIFVGMFEKVEHDIICSSVNESALQEKEDFKWNLWAQKQLKDYYNSLDAMGVKGMQQPEWLPETIQELEMYMSESFKTKLEMAMEMGLDYSFYMSQWNEIKKRMFEDWFRLGIACCMDYVEDNKVLTKYLDPVRLIVQYSRDKNFSNITHWGYIEEWSIAKLREKSGLKVEDLVKVARQYSGYGDNAADFDWDYFRYANNESHQDLPFDNWKVDVLYGEFITTESKKLKTVKTKGGAQKLYANQSVPDDEWQSAGKDNRSVTNHVYQVSKKGYWVVGTEFVFDCDDVFCMPRENKKNAKLSLNIHKYSNKSMLAAIIPNIDAIQIDWIKMQNDKAMAAPNGINIEIGALENIVVGGVSMQPLEILTLRRQTGDLIYKATTHDGEYNQMPVTPSKGGIDNLDAWIKDIDYNLNMIRQLTGMNEMIDASTPAERAPVTTSEMAVSAANNALQPIYSGYIALKENCGRHMVSRYQSLAATGTLKGHYPSLGRNIVQIFELTSACSAEDYAIKLKARPTDEMKNAIRQIVLASVQLGTKAGGISHSDALYIEDKIESGNLKYARMFLAYKEKMYAQQQEKMQADNMAANGQNMQAQEVAKAQSAIALEQVQSSNRIKETQAESQFRQQEESLRHSNKMEEIAATNHGKLADTTVKEHGKLANTFAQANVNNEDSDSNSES